MKFKVEVKVPTEVDLVPGDRVVVQKPSGDVMYRVRKICLTNFCQEGYVILTDGTWRPISSYGKNWWKV